MVARVKIAHLELLIECERIAARVVQVAVDGNTRLSGSASAWVRGPLEWPLLLLACAFAAREAVPLDIAVEAR